MCDTTTYTRSTQQEEESLSRAAFCRGTTRGNGLVMGYTGAIVRRPRRMLRVEKILVNLLVTIFKIFL